MKIGKVVDVALSLAVMASAFTGCSSTKPQSSQTSQSSQSSQSSQTSSQALSASLTFMYWDELQGPAMKAEGAEFTKQNPGVKINYVHADWNNYWTKLDAMANSGAMPDVLWMHRNDINKYASAKAVAVIPKDTVDLSNYDSNLVAGAEIDGNLYGIPKDFDTITVWYNKALFDQAKISYPASNWTWDDMVSDAKAITALGNGIYGIVAPPDTQQTYYNTVPDMGGKILTTDDKSGYSDAATIQGIQMWYDLIFKDKVSPSEKQMTDTDVRDMFKSGKIGMIWQGSWFVSDYNACDASFKAKINCVELPKVNGNSISVINGLTYAIGNSTKNMKASLALAAFMGGEQGSDIAAKMGAFIPAYKGAPQTDWVKSVPGFNLQAYINMTAHTAPYPADAASSEWFDKSETMINSCFNGQGTVADTCKQISDMMDKAIADAKS